MEEEEALSENMYFLENILKEKENQFLLVFLKSLLSVFLSIPTHRSFFFVVIDSRLTYYLSSRNTCCPLFFLFVCTLSKKLFASECLY